MPAQKENKGRLRCSLLLRLEAASIELQDNYLNHQPSYIVRLYTAISIFHCPEDFI